MILALAMAAAALAQAFECQLTPPRVISMAAGTSSAQVIDGLPASALVFELKLKGDQAEVVWKDSPIQMEGKQVVLPTSPASGMIMFLSGGPCLFTETACGTMVNFAQQPDGKLKLILLPSAITTDQDHEVRTPFVVAIEGQCMPSKDEK